MHDEGPGEAPSGSLASAYLGTDMMQLPAGHKSSLTITELDHLLDQLATLSPFSQLSQPGPSHLTQSSLLTRLFRDSDLSPYALAVLTQVILRDLRPLLNPLPRLPTRNPTAMLRLKSNTGPAQLELAQAMKCWGHRMAKLYFDGKGDLDWCADAVEDMKTKTGIRRISAGPQVGVNVQVRLHIIKLTSLVINLTPLTDTQMSQRPIGR